MNQTLGKLAELLQKSMTGGVDKPELNPTKRQAMYALQLARNQAILEYMYAILANDDRTIPFDLLDEIEIVPEKKGNHYEYTLDKRVISGLPKGSAINRIYDCDNNEVIPTQAGFTTLYSRQGAGSMEANPYYYPVKNKLKLYNINDAPLTMEAVLSGECYGEDDECIPADMQAGIIELAKKLLSPMLEVPEDVMTDGRS